ncbi:Hypothetical predicted protein [Cloeon dipterum]|uniref:Uncharacterized protein n=1 Tax=Cloeon dipterum TaxID=197152 RepID=A0A8S1CRI1_9INSE|nr:Hypothetical predicted protein [Cloeon dipterum]
MAVPLNLPTFHDPRARLTARLTRQLAKLLNTLHQLEQLDQQSSTLNQQQWLEPELGDWLILDEAAEGQQPTLIPISPMLVVDALRAVQQEEYFDQLATSTMLLLHSHLASAVTQIHRTRLMLRLLCQMLSLSQQPRPRRAHRNRRPGDK